jgi:hypothetical protein
VYRVNTNDLSSLKYLFNKTKQRREIKLTHWKWNLHFFAACGRSDITPTVVIRSAATDKIKWQLNPKKQIEFAHGGFRYTFILI